jgi:hypothetical protein
MTDAPDDTRWIGPTASVGLVALAIIVLGAAFAILPSSTEGAEAFAYDAGRYAGVTLLAALVVGASWQRAPLLFWGALVVGLGAQLLLVAAIAGIFEGRLVATLSDEDRAPPVVEMRDGVRWLHHPTLGFSLPMPEDLRYFGPDPDFARQPADVREHAMAWRWESVDHHRWAIVLASAMGVGERGHEEQFETAVTRMRAALDAPTLQVLEDRRDGDFDRRMRFIGMTDGGVAIARTIAYPHGPRFLAVTVVVASLGEVLDAPATELTGPPD